jgi:hypothetical protein
MFEVPAAQPDKLPWCSQHFALDCSRNAITAVHYGFSQPGVISACRHPKVFFQCIAQDGTWHVEASDTCNKCDEFSVWRNTDFRGESAFHIC